MFAVPVELQPADVLCKASMSFRSRRYRSRKVVVVARAADVRHSSFNSGVFVCVFVNFQPGWARSIASSSAVSLCSLPSPTAFLRLSETSRASSLGIGYLYQERVVVKS